MVRRGDIVVGGPQLSYLRRHGPEPPTSGPPFAETLGPEERAGGQAHFMTKRHIMRPAGERAKAGACGSEVWRAVGRRLAQRRTELGYSPGRVAHGVGIAVEDYKDYESGAPIPAFLLGEIAGLLDRSVTWFFEGIAQQPDGEGEPSGEAVAYKVATIEHRIQALTNSFRKLDFEAQQHLLAISRALSRCSAGAAHE